MKKLNKVIIFFLVMTLLLPALVKADTSTGPEVIRLSGKDRTQTAIKVSENAYKEGSADTVVLAGYDGQADALVGTILASEKKAPILLTYKNKLDAILVKEIDRLGASKVYILGGETVVQREVETALKAKGLNVIRLHGETRVDTAIAIADEAFENSVAKEAFVVEYNALADALAIGPVAASRKAPLYIINKSSIPEGTKKALEAKKIKDIVIIGGSDVITAKAEAELEKLTKQKAVRIAGSNRVITALNIVDKYYTSPKAIIIANGYNSLSDALVGGYFGDLKNAPILLSNKSDISSDVLEFVTSNHVDTFVLGGEASVSKDVYNSIVKALKNDTGQTGAIENVQILIENLPKVEAVTLKDEAKIMEALKAYEALKPAEKVQVKNEDMLISVYAKLEILKLKDEIETKIGALPALEALTLDHKSDVDSIRELVDILLQLDSKAYIEGIKDLEAAELKLAELE